MNGAGPAGGAAAALVAAALVAGHARAATLFEADAVAGRLHGRLAAAAAEGTFSGEMLVARRGQPVSTHVYGGVAPGALHRIASVTKGFTAAAVLLLVERGKLKLEDPVARFVPEVPPERLRHAGRDVTVDHLLTHTSGLVIRTPYRKLADGELVAALGEASFATAPGAQHAYSNGGYAVLGEIIRRVSGASSYAAFLQEGVLTPLGLTETGVVPSAEQQARLAQPLLGTVVGLRPVRALFPERTSDYLTWGGGSSGGLFSSVRDLTRWLDALGAGQLLRPEGHRLLFQPGLADYARGFVVEALPFVDGGPAPGPRRLVWHNGELSQEGCQSFVALLPEEGVSVVVLANVGAGALALTPVVLSAIRGQDPGRRLPYDKVSRVMASIRAVHAPELSALGFSASLLLPFARRPRPWPRLVMVATMVFLFAGVALGFAPRSTHLVGLGLLLALGGWWVARFRSDERWIRGEAAMAVVVAGLAGLIVAGVVAVRFVIGI